MFTYREGDVVALTKDYPEFQLSTGDEGVVWSVYTLSPPVYEVTFRGGDGQTFDMTVYNEEIMTTRRFIAVYS